ncbi:L-cystine transport system permease protein TcyB [Arthrobacter sp. Bi83]|uniref:amino acid ABC transporter permease n=1 Tax=Arthrobacter sp. Bi83 TaxID=2822353 RepID=UPI001DC6ADB8|nr:amino acid ABC transporter permease [Arthrobacter sp. Bi83]CAH0218047.1 L-cystine transport system permease protein TcyB [Arthrobacter sp. Bi83]
MTSGSFFYDFIQYLPQLLEGLKISLMITGLSLTIGVPVALFLAFGVTAKRKALRWFCVAVVEVGRGAPALVLLQLAYYGMPGAGITLPALTSAVLALSWTAAGYMAEYVRGGISAVPLGEIEACQAVGMKRPDTLRFVIIPQGLRIALPSLMGFAVMLFQATSLAYSVAVPELMSQAYSIGSSNFRYLNILIAAGVLYAAISIPSTWFSVLVEKRMNRHA